MHGVPIKTKHKHKKHKIHEEYINDKMNSLTSQSEENVDYV